MSEFYRGKKVLVTGGTGSIGMALVRSLLVSEVEVIRIYSRDESKQFELQSGEFESYAPRLRWLIGDVRDRARLERALEGIDYVFHTAALKHVPSCEYNPFEAVQTNVLGVQNLIEAALSCGVERVVNLSTDKAARPDNTMGATKLLGERLIAAGNYFRGSGRTVFTSVRFGNVLGSRGSLAPLLADQLRRSSPVTITDPEMTRFVMTTRDAVELVREALKLSRGGETVIRKMPVARLVDLVEVLVEILAPRCGRKASEVKYRVIGARPGETMFEDLVTEEEACRTLETEHYYIIIPSFAFRRITYEYPGARSCALARYTSREEAPLSREALKSFLLQAGL